MASVPPLPSPRLFVRATVTNFFFFLSMNGFVLLPLYIQQLGGNEIEIGMVMGLYSGVGIVCQPLIGPWVDVIGRRPFMLAGVALNIAASLLAALPGGVPLLALVRVIQGLAFSTFFVGGVTYIGSLAPSTLTGTAQGLFAATAGLATIVGSSLGGVVATAVTIPGLFIAAGILHLIAAVVVTFAIRRGPGTRRVPAMPA